MKSDSKRDQEAIAKRINSLPKAKRELLELLLKKQEIDGLAPILGQAPDSHPRSFLVAIQPFGSKPPLFCLPPVSGTVFPYYPLAHALGADQPVYGVQPLGIDGASKPHVRLEDIAAHAIESIRALQPRGPYRLGGYSFGGLVAFEIARQLQRAGHPVGLLALVDTWAPVAVYKPGIRDTLAMGLALTVGIWPYVYEYVSLLTAAGWQRASRRVRTWSQGSKGIAIRQPTVRALLQVGRANMRAMRRYVPQPYPQRITLFRTGKPSARKPQNPTRGWEKLAGGGVDVHGVPGDHFSVMRNPHVHRLAETLSACLDQGRPDALDNGSIPI